ncbi:hypothetical protein ACJ73_03722 [Blastomyces percursus]|uniref:Tyrosine specific protein phosphatases domain-containing protein n=1 Tax=Blastomyces percursus TaxID=1658174 RepID=A0A1J9Q801_9EURO|nr:hypothetical protein ACJ73_03722 [Blastomyces percursus]
MLAFLEEEGKAKLATGLGVKKVFDLRGASERSRFPSLEIEGVQYHWLPTVQDTVRFSWADYAVEDPTTTILKMYQNILVTHVPIYRAVFEHIRDFPDQPFFFHCTAGKGRTGVLSSLILRIAGYAPDTIVHDYILTRVGFEPIRESLYNELISKKDRDELTTEGILAAGGISYEVMVQFLGFLAEEFENGAEGLSSEQVGVFEYGY